MPPSRRDSRGPVILTLAAFYLSGIAGLGYQIVWARMFSVGLGHEIPSVFAMIVAFFGGIALGAWFLDAPVSRSARPGRWYAGLELTIGIWALATIFLIPQLNTLIHTMTGVAPSPLRHWFIAFTVPFLTLLPATVAMGATLPAMDRFVSALVREGRTIGGLYAINTLGAATGVLTSTFFLIPLLGYRSTVICFAALNFFCAWVILRRPGKGEIGRRSILEPVGDNLPAWRLHLTLAGTGLLGIGYEVLGVRVMSQVLENTVYSYASALIVYLVFTSIGAAFYHRLLRNTPFRPALRWLLIGLTTACVLGILSLWQAEELYRSIARGPQRGFAQGIRAELLIAAHVFALPTLFMGAIFSHLAQAARHEHGGVGRAISINTLGGAVAPVLFGVVLLPAFGAKLALVTVALAYLLLIPNWRELSNLVALVPVALAAMLPTSLVLVTSPESDSTVVEYREGVMAAVAVVEDRESNLYLKVNNLFYMGGTASGFSERRQAHIPLLLHPAPKRALFLGVGAGVTVGAAAIYPDLTIDAVELLPETVELVHHFAEKNERIHEQPNVNLLVADARRFDRASREQYDVIVSDLYHPARDGTGALYTREHFAAIANRLGPEGLFCQWLPLFQIDDETLRLIVRTFLDVYPHAHAFVAHEDVNTSALALVGSMEPLVYPHDWFEARTGGTSIIDSLARQQQELENGYDLFGNYIASGDQLATFAGEGPLNTDDRPLVIFRAPRFIYAQHVQPYARLQLLLEKITPDPDSLIELDDPDAKRFAAELAAYLQARDTFFNGAIHQADGSMSLAINAYIKSAVQSSRFSTGYLVAHQYALALAPSDPETARSILLALQEANPERPEAPHSLRQLFPTSS